MITSDSLIITQDKGIIRLKEESDTYFDGEIFRKREDIVSVFGSVKLFLSNGMVIRVSPDTLFGARKGWWTLKQLDDKSRTIRISPPIFDFDFLDIPELDPLTSFEKGTLMAMYYNYGANGELSVTDLRIKPLRVLLAKAGIHHTEEEYTKNKKVNLTKVIPEFDFLTYVNYDELPTEFLKSKAFLKGFLEELIIPNTDDQLKEKFIIKWKKGKFLRDVQFCLTLFGINSFTRDGMQNRTTLSIIGDDAYKFFVNSDVQKPEKFDGKFDFSRLIDYIEYRPSFVKLESVSVQRDIGTFYSFPYGVVADGIVMKDYE
jgi:hypothetical protein